MGLSKLWFHLDRVEGAEGVVLARWRRHLKETIFDVKIIS